MNDGVPFGLEPRSWWEDDAFSPDRLGRETRALDITRSIELIVASRPGTLPLHPEFGCRVHELLFRPMTTVTRAAMRFYVEIAVKMWDRRVTDVEVTVHDGQDEGAVRLEIAWRADDFAGDVVIDLVR
jgi:phage baseplate assembly protein W